MGFVAQYITGWSIAAAVCFVAGVILLVIEMCTPGMGAPGIVGICALIAAIILRADTLENAFITLALVLVIVGVCVFFILRSLKKGALSHSPLVLKETIDKGSTSLSDPTMLELTGKTGIALTALRPSGNCLIDGCKYDVISEGEFIDKGTAVRVTRVEGLRILVSAVND